MTHEERELVLKDLCGRLPYGVVAFKTYKEGSKTMESTSLIETDDIDMLLGTVEDMEKEHYTIKPYLRPMSSMTEEEKDELYTAMDWYGEIDETGNVYTKGQEKVYRETFYEYTDWLYRNMFDYRGLIPMGLALEAPEDMYKTE